MKKLNNFVKELNNWKDLKIRSFKNIKIQNVNRKKKTIENLYLMSPTVGGPILKTFIVSVFIVLLFYFTPLIINFTNQEILASNEFQNNSKKIMTYELNGQTIEKEVEGYDEKIIFELNDDLLGLKEDGTIKGKSEDLITLFKSVYTKKSN